jgi:membrane protein implicated in regulation of membrane protease activity
MTMDPLSLWLIAGLVLLISEMLTASFFLVFIALGCFAAALASSLGAPLWLQSVACAAIAVSGVLTLRKAIQKRLLKSISLSADIGREIRVDEAIAPHQQTRITYQGSSWLATNLGTEKIKQGDHVMIVGIDGNVLLIRKIE